MGEQPRHLLGICGAGQLRRAECMLSIGLPKSTVGIPSSVATMANRAATRQIGTVDILLHSDSGGLAQLTDRGRRRKRGRIALLRVVLYDRPAVEQWPVVRVVTIRIVGMQRMGHVHRHTQRS